MNHISRSNFPPILLGLAMIAAATGCATSSKSSVQGAESGAAEARPTDGQPLGRAMRLFEDALAAFEEQKSLKVYDWGLLEKKFQAALTADDQFAEAHYNLGVVYERMRRPEDAKRAYQRALQIKPYLKEAAENLAIVLQAEGRLQARCRPEPQERQVRPWQVLRPERAEPVRERVLQPGRPEAVQ